MKLRRTLFGFVLAAAAVGVVNPSTPAQAQCDPGPTSTGPSTSQCSNTCPKLDAAVNKLTGRDFFDCTQ